MQIFVSSLFLSYGSQFTSHNLPLFKSVILVIDGSNRAIDHAKKLTKEFDVYSFCVYISVRLTLDRPNIETQCRRGADTGALCRPHHRLWHMTLMTQWAPCHGNIGRYVSEILISPDTASCLMSLRVIGATGQTNNNFLCPSLSIQHFYLQPEDLGWDPLRTFWITTLGETQNLTLLTTDEINSWMWFLGRILGVDPYRAHSWRLSQSTTRTSTSHSSHAAPASVAMTGGSAAPSCSPAPTPSASPASRGSSPQTPGSSASGSLSRLLMSGHLQFADSDVQYVGNWSGFPRAGWWPSRPPSLSTSW